MTDPRREVNPMVAVRDLSVSVAGSSTLVASGISFDIGAGQVLAVVGESGSGKSTVGLAMLAYARRGLAITSGSVEIDGLDILALPERDVRRLRGRVVSYVPQDPATSLDPAYRVGSQLRETFKLHRGELNDIDIEDRCAQLLDDVALPHSILDRFPHQISGGQQQRINIAIAFACTPKLVVLDEPTTGLDVTTQRHVLNTVADLARSYGVSALYISHDLPAVGEIAGMTAVMYGGRVVEYGETSKLFTDPRHPYTARLLAAAPSPYRSTRLVGIDGHPPRPGRWPAGCSFATRCASVEEDCRTEVPELIQIEPGHLARCAHPVARGTLAVLAGKESPVPAPGEQASISVKGLSANYGSATVLHDVTFEAGEGLCTAIVGESGSGKTTLARCIAGLHSRWTGSISTSGRELSAKTRQRSKADRRLIQYVFQNPFASLNPTMTVIENIEEPLRHFERLSGRERRERALSALAAVALSSEFADQMPGQLSGGERQRVAVGRALVVEPEVLICDEVTSALDVSVQALLVEQLRDLQLTRGLSMVFITHNLAVVRSLAQRVVVLQAGKVVEQGWVADVLDNPQHEYTRQLLSDVPHLAGIEDRRATAS
ncbi:ABC transporter ATP-binding protein [soil metagenome]